MSGPSTSARYGATAAVPDRVIAIGRGLALAGVVLPLVLIGILKFTQYEIDMLRPLIQGTPWLAWLHPVLGEAWTSYLLGVAELLTAALLIATPFLPGAAIAGGALGAVTFATTTSTMLALPIWEPSLGGFPYLNPTGSFLIKDVALLGISLVALGEGLTRHAAGRR